MSIPSMVDRPFGCPVDKPRCACGSKLKTIGTINNLPVCGQCFRRALRDSKTVKPIVTVLELPVPPSTNRLWRTTGAGKGYKSPTYTEWLQQAGFCLVMDGKLRTRRTITGPFSAEIDITKPREGSDLDNRVKAIFDFCQQHQFISNDRNLEWYRVRWSKETMRGCRVMLREETPA